MHSVVAVAPQHPGESTIATPQGDLYLSIVLPCYNEQKRLPDTLRRVGEFLRSRPYSAEVVVVDDGSSDDTAALVEQAMRQDPSIRLIKNEHRGKAYAVRTGMLAAEGRYVLFTDADGATPITELDQLLALLEAGADVAIASREGAGARRIGEPWHRHVMGRVFNLIVRIVALPGIHDTQCGFKCFRREAARDLFSGMRLYGDQAGTVRGALLTGFGVEVLVLARKWGYRIAEAPVAWYYGSESNVNPLKDSWRNLRDVLLVRWNDLRGRYPQK